jgi:hypothetical protein
MTCFSWLTLFFFRTGSPKELYDAKGQFYDMMKHSGEFEDLEKSLNTKE